MSVEKSCENCGQPFFSYPSDDRRFCSLACRSAKRFGKPNIAPGREVVRFTCKECSKPFGMMQSYLTEYRKKHTKDPMYCSRDCSNIGRRKDSEQRNTFTCINCGETLSKSRKPGGRIYAQQRYCSIKCKIEFRKKSAFERFKNGGYKRHVKRHGYVWISVPELAREGKQRSMLEHRYIMEQSLGRKLYPEETVHHKDGDRHNNAIENLELFSNRHGPGQRVTDKVTFAIEILGLYPDFAERAGVRLVHL